MIGQYKSVFHSTLADAGDIFITVKGRPARGKFPKKGTQDYPMVVEIEHDGSKQYLTLENQQCIDTMASVSGQSVTIRATGKGKDARIDLIDSQGHVKQGPTDNSGQGSARSDSSAGSGQPTGHSDSVTAFKKGVMQVQNAIHIIKKGVALEVQQSEIDGMDPRADQIQAQISTTFIKLDRAGLVDQLPSKPMWSIASKEKPDPVPEPEPPKGPAPKDTDPKDDPEW